MSRFVEQFITGTLTILYHIFVRSAFIPFFSIPVLFILYCFFCFVFCSLFCILRRVADDLTQAVSSAGTVPGTTFRSINSRIHRTYDDTMAAATDSVWVRSVGAYLPSFVSSFAAAVVDAADNLALAAAVSSTRRTRYGVCVDSSHEPEIQDNKGSQVDSRSQGATYGRSSAVAIQGQGQGQGQRQGQGREQGRGNSYSPKKTSRVSNGGFTPSCVRLPTGVYPGNMSSSTHYQRFHDDGGTLETIDTSCAQSAGSQRDHDDVRRSARWTLVRLVRALFTRLDCRSYMPLHLQSCVRSFARRMSQLSLYNDGAFAPPGRGNRCTFPLNFSSFNLN